MNGNNVLLTFITVTRPETVGHRLKNRIKNYGALFSVTIQTATQKQSYQLPLASDLLEVHNHTSKFYFIIDSPKFIFSLLPTFEPL